MSDYLGPEDEVLVVIAQPGSPAVQAKVPNTYERLRAIIGGPITGIRTEEIVPGTIAYYHDEGLLLGLPWNRHLHTYIAGPLVAYGSNRKGEEISLTREQAAMMVEWWNLPTVQLAPTPSSVEELERRTGQAARGFASVDRDGTITEERMWASGRIERKIYRCRRCREEGPLHAGSHVVPNDVDGREGCVKCENEGPGHEGPHVEKGAE